MEPIEIGSGCPAHFACMGADFYHDHGLAGHLDQCDEWVSEDKMGIWQRLSACHRYMSGGAQSVELRTIVVQT